MNRRGFIRKIAQAILCVSLLAAGFHFSSQKETFQSSFGASLEIFFRSCEPGEIILVVLKDPKNVKKTTVQFLENQYSLASPEEGFEPFGLIGLDLNLRPGTYVMDILIEAKDGTKENLRKEIAISSREFPLKKMWIKEKYVIPPPEVEERIEREAELLQLVYSKTNPRWLGEGVFILPHPGKLSANFGERRVYNNVPRSTHSGVDVAAPLGEPVKAANSGTVAMASDLYFSGKTVILDHGLGLFTFYCHFSKIKVKRGDVVKKGEVIGLAGTTGRSTGPHLHWGAKIYGNRVDPLALLSLPLR